MRVISKEKLSLAHKDLLHDRLSAIETPVSEFSFANLYLFRRVHEYEVIRAGDDIYIAGRSYDNKRFLMPTVDPRKGGMESLRAAALAEGVDFVYPVAEEMAHVFAPPLWTITHEDGDSDYLYDSDKMRTYAGRRLHRKRNLLKQFTSLYKHDARPLTKDLMGDTRRVLDEWLRESGQDADVTDYPACSDALSLYEELVLCGGIYYADGEPAGFAIGEERPPETFVLHFAKGLTKFKGVYQYMFNHFARLLPERYRYMNLEQDLNIEALRAAKSSYQPDRMLIKGRAAPAAG